MSDAELLADVLRLHHRTEEQAIVATECVREECAHDDCPTEPVAVCAQCWDIIESAYEYAFENDAAWKAVIWPCGTALAAGVAP